MQDFLEAVAEVLEVPTLRPEDEFRSVPIWGSLTGFALAVLLEQRYGKRVKAGDFANLKTVADLAAYAGVDLV